MTYLFCVLFCFLNDTATTEVCTYCHTLSLHYGLPISINDAAVLSILDVTRDAGIRVQLGGGIRDLAGIESWLEDGIDRVILGTAAVKNPALVRERSEEHTSELQSLMRISYAVLCLKKKTIQHSTIRYYR